MEFSCFNRKALILVTVLCNFIMVSSLEVGFYSQTCPNAESIVSTVVQEAFSTEQSVAAKLLRLHFHDCFVEGCDGSILIDSGDDQEKNALGHQGLEGFNSNGPSYEVSTGRSSIQLLRSKFQKKGLTDKDLVLLSAAHTIGTTACFFMQERLYEFPPHGGSDPSINPAFLPDLKSMCPKGGNSERLPLDPGSERIFDDHILRNIKNGLGVMQSDARLFNDSVTKRIIDAYVGIANIGSKALFNRDFAAAVVKMGLIGVKSGSDGEIRPWCWGSLFQVVADILESLQISNSRDIIIPGNVDDRMTRDGENFVQPLPLSRRKYLANYLGCAQGKVGRLQLLELAKQYPDKVATDPFPLDAFAAVDHKEAGKTLLESADLKFKGPDKLESEDYFQHLHNAKFCLAPRGESSWSLRFYEFFFVECVPVILSDQIELPFQNIIDYKKISIKWPSTRIGPQLLEYLESIPDKYKEEMIAHGRQVMCLFVYAPESELCTAIKGILRELQRKVRLFHQSTETFWLHCGAVRLEEAQLAQYGGTFLSVSSLEVGFYNKTCPDAESIVTSVVSEAFSKNPALAPKLLRLHFHDCFVERCDGSILVEGDNAEKNAVAHQGLDGFDVIKKAKAKLEKACPSTVSCSGIVALAARDAVFWSHGPFYEVPTGRRDGLISNISHADGFPSVDDSIKLLVSKFVEKGLTDKELVVLAAGAHTIGTTACFFMLRRLYEFPSHGGADPSINPSLLPRLKSKCPRGGIMQRLPLDWNGEKEFDNHIFHNIKRGYGLLESDAGLCNDSASKPLIDAYDEDPRAFYTDFTAAMVRMGSIGVKTGSEGNIRRICNVFN
ncbi:Exostosin, GT47 domain [Dillenia turbinata]|uniref:peroxidase n=1 Tax=Dillenia turbinata TaxID=194707 RepID=A0AAN8W3C5_9MAGN